MVCCGMVWYGISWGWEGMGCMYVSGKRYSRVTRMVISNLASVTLHEPTHFFLYFFPLYVRRYIYVVEPFLPIFIFLFILFFFIREKSEMRREVRWDEACMHDRT
jgi:hypothetical protein